MRCGVATFVTEEWTLKSGPRFDRNRLRWLHGSARGVASERGDPQAGLKRALLLPSRKSKTSCSASLKVDEVATNHQQGKGWRLLSWGYLVWTAEEDGSAEPAISRLAARELAHL